MKAQTDSQSACARTSASVRIIPMLILFGHINELRRVTYFPINIKFVCFDKLLYVSLRKHIKTPYGIGMRLHLPTPILLFAFVQSSNAANGLVSLNSIRRNPTVLTCLEPYLQNIKTNNTCRDSFHLLPKYVHLMICTRGSISLTESVCSN